MSGPTFQTVFGSGWHELPSALQQRYANRPFTHDVVTIEGQLTIEMSRLMRLLAPILRLTRTLVPWPGENIPVTVRFRSEPGSDACHFERSFRFPGRRPWHFTSTLRPRDGADLIETMPVGIGWQARYTVDGAKVGIAHRAYRVNLFGSSLRLPLEWLLGRGTAEEAVIDDTHFRMAMTIDHPLLGMVYGYRGTFAIVDVERAD